MAINLTPILFGTTIRHELSIYDSANAAIDMTGGTVSVFYVSLGGTSFSKTATLSGTPSVAPQAFVDLLPADYASLTTPTLAMATVTATTSGGTVYKAEFSQPIMKSDTEWAYGFATVAETREALGLTATTSDHLVGAAIQAVTARIKRLTARAFRSTTYVEAFDGEYSDTLPLRESPVTSITSIAVQTHPSAAATTLTANDYTLYSTLGEVKLLASSGWYYPGMRSHYGDSPRSITVTYVGGYATVPYDLKATTIGQVRAMAPTWGLSGSGATPGMKSEGLGSYTYTKESAEEADAQIRAELGDYIRIGI